MQANALAGEPRAAQDTRGRRSHMETVNTGGTGPENAGDRELGG